MSGRGWDIDVTPSTALADKRATISPDGAFLVSMINDTGQVSERGRLVEHGTIFDSVQHAGIGSLDPIGAIWNAGVAIGSLVWVAVAGRVWVLLDDNTGTTIGNWCQAGTGAGYVDATLVAPNPPTHWAECGHSIETVAATGVGTHVGAWIVMHFN